MCTTLLDDPAVVQSVNGAKVAERGFGDSNSPAESNVPRPIPHSLSFKSRQRDREEWIVAREKLGELDAGAKGRFVLLPKFGHLGVAPLALPGQPCRPAEWHEIQHERIVLPMRCNWLEVG